MKKKLLSFVLVFAIVFGVTVIKTPAVTQAAAKKSAFITNAKFKGTYGYEGNNGSFESGWYNLVINKITAGGKVRFQVERGGPNGSPLYQTNVLTVKIKGSTAKFTYDEDGWGNKGKGTIVFKKNGTIYLTVTETYTSEYNRSTLEIPKALFKKVSASNKVNEAK